MQGAVLMHVCARVLVRARVTHEADVAAYAKRRVKFKDGRIVYDGPVSAEGIAL